MDRAPKHQSQPEAPATPTEAELRAVTAQSDRDVAAGHTVPIADVLAELDTIADRAEARRHLRRA
jgi:hypothetical protein